MGEPLLSQGLLRAVFLTVNLQYTHVPYAFPWNFLAAYACKKQEESAALPHLQVNTASQQNSLEQGD